MIDVSASANLKRFPSIVIFLIFWVLAVSALFVILHYNGGFSSNFSGSDEPAHFVSSIFMSDIYRLLPVADTMQFAESFYIHYPKLAIGHWPPGYYLFSGAVFSAITPSYLSAIVMTISFTALVAAILGLICARYFGRVFGIIAVLLYVCMPTVIQSSTFVLTDQFLMLIIASACIAWWAYARHPSTRRALQFGFLVAAAIMVKGNGWLLCLMPVFHIALTNRWFLLRRPSVYLTPLFTLVICVPWYWLFTSVTKDGFVYQAGWVYISKALPFAWQVLIENLGPVGLGLVFYFLYWSYSQRSKHPYHWELCAMCLAMALASLVLFLALPVDLVSRYLIPLLAVFVGLAVGGLWRIFVRFRLLRPGGTLAVLALVVLFIGMVVPSALSLFQGKPKRNLRMAEVADLLMHKQKPQVILIDGSPAAEGALVAEVLLRDPQRASYVLRSSKLLSDSSFMGGHYRLKLKSPEAVLKKLKSLHIATVVIAKSKVDEHFPHNSLMVQTLASTGSGFERIVSLPHLGRPGAGEVTEVYRACGTPVVVDLPLLQSEFRQSKIGG
jgi:Dolichyl-phosphate-mannose-protein mannosyltransferase